MVMVVLTQELQGLVQLFEARADQRRGAVLAFVGVTGGCGTSTCARAFSRLIAPNAARGVWLFDLDFYVNEQYKIFASPAANRVYGGIGAPLDPTLKMDPFWRVSLLSHTANKRENAHYMTLHQIGSHRLFVSRFRTEALRIGQDIHITRAPAYWQRMRDAIDLAVIDVPARDRSRSILRIAPDVDGVILVAEPQTHPRQLISLQREIEAAGGTCLGLVYNAPQAMPHAWPNLVSRQANR